MVEPLGVVAPFDAFTYPVVAVHAFFHSRSALRFVVRTVPVAAIETFARNSCVFDSVGALTA